jgi:hypothetical protein
MANHKDSCARSKLFCEQLFTGLNKKIGNLEYGQGANKCSIKARGNGVIFAWVNSHSSRVGRLNIWFLGDAEEAKKFPGLEIKPRNNPDNAGGWAGWGGSFSINNERQLAEAISLLLSISYPQSIR